MLATCQKGQNPSIFRDDGVQQTRHYSLQPGILRDSTAAKAPSIGALGSKNMDDDYYDDEDDGSLDQEDDYARAMNGVEKDRRGGYDDGGHNNYHWCSETLEESVGRNEAQRLKDALEYKTIVKPQSKKEKKKAKVQEYIQPKKKPAQFVYQVKQPKPV